MARSLTRFYYVKATLSPRCIICYLRVTVNNINLFSVAMETQEWISFALLPCYKIFRTVANCIILLRSSCKVPEFDARLQVRMDFLDSFFPKLSFDERPSSGNRSDTCGLTYVLT